VEKTTLAQQGQSLAHVLRAIWPCPDKNPQLRELRRGIEAQQSTSHFRPGIHSSHLLLHMPVALQEKLPCSTLFASSPPLPSALRESAVPLRSTPPRLDHRHG
jgi:hypothetical protein